VAGKNLGLHGHKLTALAAGRQRNVMQNPQETVRLQGLCSVLPEGNHDAGTEIV
jgi:hypothetical protein